MHMATKTTTSKFVLLDYNGSIGSRPDCKRKIPHTMSPLNAAMPSQGVPSLHLQPGFNRRDAAVWAKYAEFPGIPERVKSREIRVIDDVLSVDENTLTSMIDRSYCHESLMWLRGELQAAASIDGINRDGIIQSIDQQLTKRPVAIQSVPYVRPPMFVPQPAASPA